MRLILPLIALGVSSLTLNAAVYLEPAVPNGTGSLVATALSVPPGTSLIAGELTDTRAGFPPNFVDLYEFQLQIGGSVTTVPDSSVLTLDAPSLFLFDALGLGIKWAAGDVLTGQTRLSSIGAGTYHLGISFYGMFPASDVPPSPAGDIFDSLGFGGGATGPGASAPLAGWYGSLPLQWDISAYRIQINEIPEPATLFTALLPLALLWFARRRSA